MAMKVMHKILAVAVFLMLMLCLHSQAVAGQGGADSLTITVDRNVMPVSIFHPGLFWTKAETVTVYDFVIRDYLGKPIDGFIVQTSSGRTKVPIETVKEFRHKGWIKKNTEDIVSISYVVPVKMVLTDGTVLKTLMNADFGTIEGMTDLGEFFVGDPHTVTYLSFNRFGEAPQPEITDEPLVDSDGDGVPDDADLCPDTPPGVAVDDFGCPLDSDGDGVPDYLDNCPDTPAGAPIDESGCPLDSDGDGVADHADKCPDTPKGATVNAAGCWTLKGINFDYNKSDIKAQYYPVLDANVEVLKNNPTLAIEVQGHTDSIASDGYNQVLSEKRASAAQEYLKEKGIDLKRVSTQGLGESQPIATNDTPEGRAENRRIEIKVLSR